MKNPCDSPIESLLVSLVKENTAANERLLGRVKNVEDRVKELEGSVKEVTKELATINNVQKTVTDIWNELRGLVVKILIVSGIASAISFVLGYFLPKH